MKTYSVSKLFFKHIVNTDLQKLGVSAMDLALQLEKGGFITVLQDRYTELPKLHDPESKEEYWNLIRCVEPSFPRKLRHLRTLGILFLIGVGLFGFEFRDQLLDSQDEQIILKHQPNPIEPKEVVVG